MEGIKDRVVKKSLGCILFNVRRFIPRKFLIAITPTIIEHFTS